jgi:hypothetical protein
LKPGLYLLEAARKPPSDGHIIAGGEEQMYSASLLHKFWAVSQLPKKNGAPSVTQTRCHARVQI